MITSTADATDTAAPPPAPVDVEDLEAEVQRLDLERRDLGLQVRLLNHQASGAGENPEAQRRIEAVNGAWLLAEQRHAEAAKQLRKLKARGAAMAQLEGAQAVGDEHRQLAGEIAELSERLQACLRAEQALAGQLVRETGAARIDLCCSERPDRMLELLTILERDSRWASRPAPAQQQEAPQ
jgi:predicted metal-dependent hydrolase